MQGYPQVTAQVCLYGHAQYSPGRTWDWCTWRSDGQDSAQPSLVRPVEREVLTELLDETKAGTFRCRRWLLRAEVEALAAKRKA